MPQKEGTEKQPLTPSFHDTNVTGTNNLSLSTIITVIEKTGGKYNITC